MKLNGPTCKISAIALAMLAAMASGCGGSSSDSDDTRIDSIASRGMITGFGSVYVNGIRFHTGGTRFIVDDNPGSEAELRIGMVVTVRGSTDDRRNWRAEHIEYDNELKGPVASITPDPLDLTRKTLLILGQNVEINANTTFDYDDGLSFATVALGDVLEVSGFTTDSGLVATHVELQANDDEVEIRGRIDNLTMTSFTINGFPVSYDTATEREDISTLADDLLVEVEGRLDGAGTSLIADKIEGEDDDFDDVDEFEIEGVISDFDPADDSFIVQGMPVDAGGAVHFPTSLVLADGVTVEVEGQVVKGVLFADKVKQRGNKIKISAPLAAVGSDRVTFRFNGSDVVARVSAQTELEDQTGNPVTQLADFSAGNFVELEAFGDGSGVINAVEIERESANEIEIEAPLQNFVKTTRRVRLLGIDFDLSAATFEDENDVNMTAEAFFDALAVGRFIEIEDSDSNGVFDKAELED